MKIINAGYEILSDIDGIKELQHIEKIGRVCYKSEDKITDDGESAKKFVKMLIDRGHEAMIEHSSLSVKFIVDRGISHELVRHRIASFAQESTRYCNYSSDKFDNGITFIQPCWIKEDLTGIYKVKWDGKALDKPIDIPFEKFNARGARGAFDWFWNMAAAERDYMRLLEKGWSPQQARSVLPNSTKTEIVITANYREWRNFFKLRTDTPAHPQMREVTIPLLKELKTLIPVVFDDIKFN